MLHSAIEGILATREFRDWIGSLGFKRRAIIDGRLDRVVESGHLGDWKPLGDGLNELRWKNGARVYFSYTAGERGRIMLILWGGDKNGQCRDIAKARRIRERAGA